MRALATEKPDILVLSSHIQDGIAFRRSFLAAGSGEGVHGTTMAQCDQDFGNRPRPPPRSAVRLRSPQGDFNPGAAGIRRLGALYNRFAALWKQRHRRGRPGRGGDCRVHRGVGCSSRMSSAARGMTGSEGNRRGRTIPSIFRAAASPTGAVWLFSSAAGQLGQNTRAAAVVWQWAVAPHSVVVWPPVYATGQVQALGPS